MLIVPKAIKLSSSKIVYLEVTLNTGIKTLKVVLGLKRIVSLITHNICFG